MKKACLSLILAISILFTFCPIISSKVYAGLEDESEELRTFLKGYNCSYEFVSCDESRHHDWELIKYIPPTCTKPGYKVYKHCSKLYLVRIDPIGHKYPPKWKLCKEPTCTEPGIEYKQCQNEGCTERETRKIEPTGHKFGEDWQVEKEPTCTESGIEYRQCQNDGCTERETREVEATGHKFGEDWQVEKEPTCTEPGIEYRQCQNEGCSERETREIESTGHKFGEKWEVEKEPTCTESGLEYRQCQNEGCTECETREIEPTGHDFIETIIEPSHTEDGYKEYACDECNCICKNDYVKALGYTSDALKVLKPAEQKDELKQINVVLKKSDAENISETLSHEKNDTEYEPISDFNTGDNLYIIFWVGSGIVALSTVLILKRKKKLKK